MKAAEKPYLVIGGAHNWGCGNTPKEALKEARKNAYCGCKEYEFETFYMEPEAIDEYWVDGMGTLNWTWNLSFPEGTAMSRVLRGGFYENYRTGRFRRGKDGKITPLEKGLDTPPPARV